MKTKKLRDIIIGFSLISTLTISTILVSCSDEGGIISISDKSNQGHHNLGESSIYSSAISATFQAVGKGAGKEAGEVGMGWVLGAMGLTSQSSNWNAQLAEISAQLDSIINLLSNADNELNGIDSVLNVIDCTLWTTTLSPYTTAITDSYDIYTSYLYSARGGDTISNTDMSGFANTVINGTKTAPSILDALNYIESNIRNQSGAIVACMQPIPQPANGTIGLDSIYYEQAQSLLNNYYYYLTIGLGLMCEAYHYTAWVDAGSPGNEYTSADSVQLVCDENSQSDIDCNTVLGPTNSVYITMVSAFDFVGDGYSDSTKIYQKTSSGESIVYARSLEDYTLKSGANCNYPLNSSNICGPTTGLYNQSLSSTTYDGTQNFHFISVDIMRNELLNDISAIENFSTIGDYLESLGFYNMKGKVLITDTLVKIDHQKLDTMYVVPFTFTDMTVFKDCGGNKHTVYYTNDDFCTVIGTPDRHSEGSCGGGYGTIYKYTFSVTNGAASSNNWFNLNGNSLYCSTANNNNSWLQPIIWNSNSTNDSPGWSYYLENSNPQKGFLIPVKTDFTGTDGCLPGYSNFNAGGAITKCGSDYQDYLSVNLPIPPTCYLSGVSPSCFP
jgi:hypothetical protein